MEANTQHKKSSYAQEFARKGGLARAKKLSKARRKKIASNAAKARWQKKNTPE